MKPYKDKFHTAFRIKPEEKWKQTDKTDGFQTWKIKVERFFDSGPKGIMDMLKYATKV